MSILKRILSLLKRSKPKDVFGLFDNPDASKHDNRVFAIATEAGVLLFSNTPKGKKAQGSYLQSLADSFFNLTKTQETLRIYEMDLPTKRVAELADNCIDKLSKADLRSEDTQLRRSVVSFTPDKFVGPEVLEGAVCKDKFDLRPDFHNFDRLTKEFSLGISPRNYDVASLLYISENGYAGHVVADKFHPFSYQYEFRELAEKLGDSIKARQNAPLSAHDFGYTALQKEAKVMAADILQSEFHLHGGEFSLSGRKAVSTIERNQKQDLEFSTLDGEIDKRQERSQVKHVPSITAKKEKKQLIL
jgi:hypothetical protein